MRQYLYSLLAALSQLLNALTGGDRDQTFSSRTHEAYLIGKWWAVVVRFVINRVLFFWQDDHVLDAFEADTERTYQ